MKFLWVIALLLCSQVTSAKMTLKEHTDWCDASAKLGMKYMDYRQKGRFLSNVIREIKETNVDRKSFMSQEITDAAVEMAEQAYEIPIYTDENQKLQAKVQFMNEIYNECMSYKRTG